MSTDLNVNFLGIRMKTPIIAASGTFGFGVEYKDYMDLSQIGAISCKGIAITPWDGNEGVRIAETSLASKILVLMFLRKGICLS